MTFMHVSDLSQISPVVKTKGHPSNIHSKSQWMSMANPVAVLKKLIPGFSDLCLS
jgi:hypothetical protein